MAIKSKKDDLLDKDQEQRPQREKGGFWAWMLFFLGVNLFVVTGVLCIYTAISIGSVSDLQTVMRCV